ncbi:hypothetical protein, partial [Burkholderia sp. BE12]|uniref:hypothetical protein n=1 Tax=Burkholderia sp. BE12 TaxID=2082394 RepID=UPI001F2FB1E8
SIASRRRLDVPPPAPAGSRSGAGLPAPFAYMPKALPGYRAWAAAACRKAGRLAADVLDPPTRHAVTEALDGYVAHRRRNGIEVGGRVASGDPDGRTSFAKTRDALPRSIERQILAGRDAASESATASNASTRDALPGECRVVAEVLPDCSHSRAARLNTSHCDIK